MTNRRLPSLLISALLTTSPCLPQSNLATVTGTVIDSSQAIITGAKVSITNTATGENYQSTSGETGVFVIPQLKPGAYVLKVEHSGFRPYQRTGIVLETAARARLDVTLDLGGVTEAVTVEATAPLLQSETSSVAATVNNQTIANMPLIDRRAAQLAKLSGFVSAGLPTGGSANNSAFSIAGGRADNNQWLIDGAVVQNSTVDTPGLFFDPPIESLQEFTISISNFAAELGRTGGGVIQMTTRSGTNAFHGTAYEYLRNDAFDARSFFAAVKPKLRYNLFGASLGGPVIRNRTFFFFNYEGIRNRFGQVVISNIPSPAEIRGDFSTSSAVVRDPSASARPQFPGNIIPASRLDPVGAAIAALYPSPNIPGRPSGNANYRANQSTTSPHNIYVARVDHNFSDTDRMNVRLMQRSNPETRGPIFPQAGIDSFNQIVNTTNIDIVGSWSHSFSPSFINEARANFGQRVANQWHGGLDQGLPTKLGLTGTNPKYFPRISLTGLETMGNANRQERRQDPVTSIFLVENMTKIVRSHSLKWGGEYRVSSNTDYFFGTAGGSFAFTDVVTGSGLASLLLGWVQSASRQENLPLKARADTVGLFVQDDWKVTRNFTLNAGVRWDYDQPRWEQFGNRQNGFDRLARNPVSGTPGVITFAGRNGQPASSANADWNNFGPRVGFAWQPREKWAIRGAAGLLILGQYTNNVTFDPSLGFSLQGSVVSPDNGVTPPFLLRNGLPAMSFPKDADLTAGFGAVPPGQSPVTSVLFLDRDRRNGYLESFSLNVQRQFRNTWVAEAAYVGNFGHKLPGASARAINQVPTEQLGPGNAQLRRPFPQFSGVSVLQPAIGNSNYHGLNLHVQKRYAYGLHFNVNYTWSRFIDDISARVELGGIGGSGFTNYYDRRGDRGLSGNAMNHRFVFSSVYELPFGDGAGKAPIRNRIGRLVAAGWSLGYIAELRSGSPFGVTEASNRTGSFSEGNRPNVVGDPYLSPDRSRADRISRWFNTSAFAAPADFTFGNAGKTVGYGPGAINMDISLLRDFRIGERHRLQFRGESLNFLNRPNFANPVIARGNAAFGRITGLQPGNQNRIVQLGLRYSF